MHTVAGNATAAANGLMRLKRISRSWEKENWHTVARDVKELRKMVLEAKGHKGL